MDLLGLQQEARIENMQFISTLEEWHDFRSNIHEPSGFQENK